MAKPVAIITGAGRGIGRAVAEQLGQMGFDLALVSRNESELNDAAKSCGGVALAGDVTSPDQVEKIVAQVIKRFGTINALVHSAGMTLMESIESTTTEQWRAVIDTNLSAAFYFSRALWPVFKANGSGVIVNVSSEASRDPFPQFSAYAPAKAGVNMLGLVLAREGERHQIRVHTVAPSATETKMLRGLFSREQFSEDKTMVPAEVAKVIVQCITGELKYTNGEVIYLHRDMP